MHKEIQYIGEVCNMDTIFKGLANKWMVLALLLVALGAVLTITLLPAGAQNGGDAIEFPENSDETIAYFTAVDPEGGTASWANDPLSGTDEGAFNFDKDTGALSFKSEPDFESPTDEDGTSPSTAEAGDNIYEVVLTATDGTATMTEVVMVKVTNENEKATTVLELSLVQPREGDFITVVYADKVGNPYVDAAGVENTSIVDPDGDKGEVPPINAEDANAAKMNITEMDDTEDPPVELVTWQWYRGSSRAGPWTEIPGPNAKKKSYDVVDDDKDKYLMVVATYEDAHGPNKMLEAVSKYPTIKLVADYKTPVFPDFDPSTSPTPIDGPTEEVADGTTGQANVGSLVLASGDTIERGERPTYYLVATDDSLPHADMFQIDRATGQVKVGIGKTLNPASDSGRPASDQLANPGAPVGGYMVTIKINDGKDDYDAVGRVERTVGTVPDAEYDSSTSMTITVTEEDEAPIFTMGETAYDYSENKREADDSADDLNVANFVAYDPEGDAPAITLSGPDVRKFATEGATNVLTDGTTPGALSFVASTPRVAGDQPDFENPEDANEDGVYEVTVTATSGSKTNPLSVRVTVTNAQDPGEVSLSARQPRIGVPISAMVVSDEDGDVSGLRWQWSATRELPDDCLAATLEALNDDEENPRWQTAKGDGTRTATYTPQTADDGKCLRATAMYTDPAGSTNTAEVSALRAEKARNLSPMFMDENDDADGIQIKTRYVIEPSGAGEDVEITANIDEGRQVVAGRDGAVSTADADPNADRIVATDLLDEETADDDAIEYSLSGADARYFNIYSVAEHSVDDPFDSTDTTQTTNAGQIWVKPGVNLDFETRRTYRVMVTAKDLADDDESRNDPSVWVEIKVVNAEEPPEIMRGRLAVEGVPLVEHDSMSTDDVGEYRAVGVDAPGAEWSLSGADMDDFSISAGGVLTFNNPPNINNSMDDNNDNVYMVTVVATNGDSIDSLDVTVTVGRAAEAAPDPTSLDDFDPDQRFDLNGDGTVDDSEVRAVLREYFADNPGN